MGQLSRPEFCLGSTMYPVDLTFDWSADHDVLLDAIRETFCAIRMHTYALLTPDRDWLVCECEDVKGHLGQLLDGHLQLSVAARSQPIAIPDEAYRRRSPVTNLFLGFVQVLALAVGALAAGTALLPLTA